MFAETMMSLKDELGRWREAGLLDEEAFSESLGAAGLSAARRLQAAAREVVLFEARDRPGGRAFTDYSLAPHGVELGAEFIHGERVSTWEWIRAFDAPTTGEAHRYEMWFHLDGSLLDTRTARQRFGTDFLFALEELRSRWQQSGRPATTLDRVLELWPEFSAETLTTDRKQLLENYIRADDGERHHHARHTSRRRRNA